MTEWVMVLLLAGNTPVVTASGYQNDAQCQKAGELMQRADQTARGSWGASYTITCTEQTKP